MLDCVLAVILCLLLLLVSLTCYIVCCLSWFSCFSYWFHYYARLCAVFMVCLFRLCDVCHGLFELHLGVIVCLLFLLVSLAARLLAVCMVCLLFLLVALGILIACCLTWFVCCSFWCQWYARLCAVSRGLLALPLADMLEYVLSVVVYLLFLLLS